MDPVSQLFHAEPREVAQARRLTRRVLTREPEFDAETAELLTSELATNVIKHSGSPWFVVSFEKLSGRMRITVGDEATKSPWPPLYPKEPTAEEPEGRGLYLVARYAVRWGTVMGPGLGVAVWFELAQKQANGQPAAVAS